MVDGLRPLLVSILLSPVAPPYLPGGAKAIPLVYLVYMASGAKMSPEDSWHSPGKRHSNRWSNILVEMRACVNIRAA